MYIQALLYEVQSRDPSTLALTAFTLMTAALAASYIPVCRVLRQNPLASLRNE